MSAGPAWPGVQAPGKVFLAGEYGVLLGAPAAVVAVDRHVRIGEGPPADDPLVHAVLREAAAALGEVPVEVLPRIDDGPLHGPGGGKLGLGSSAAKAAALTGSFFLRAGLDPADGAVRRRILDCALAAHREAGGGSGADVAASVLGGALEYRLSGVDRDATAAALAGDAPTPAGEALSPDVRALALPAAHFPIVVHGNAPLSSRHALTRLGEALRRAPAHVNRLLRSVECTGEALVSALGRTDAGALVDAVDGAAEALLALTDALDLGPGAGLEALTAARSVARRHGGAAKPSGAGGGDLILVFVPRQGPAARAAVTSDLDKAGLHVLEVGLDLGGVRPYPGPALGAFAPEDPPRQRS